MTLLNGSTLVQERTRNVVRQAAREPGYRPNIAARNLSQNRTDALGILLPDLYGEFFSEVIRGMDVTARKHNYHLIVSSSHNSKKEIEAALQIMSGRVDGLIIMSPHIDAHTLNTNLSPTLPIILLNCQIDGEKLDAINIDNFGGAYEVVKHLAEHGHRRIAIIMGTHKNIDAEERLRGYRAALNDSGISSLPEREFPGNFTEASGWVAALGMLRVVPRPTAIFASNDAMAIGAISALRAAGVRLPEEIAITGFDDIPIASYLSPALTTARVKISELGAHAVERLLEIVKRKKKRTEAQQILLKPQLVVRESCGCFLRLSHQEHEDT
jgi:LacI family transcriptional regulator